MYINDTLCTTVTVDEQYDKIFIELGDIRLSRTVCWLQRQNNDAYRMQPALSLCAAPKGTKETLVN